MKEICVWVKEDVIQDFLFHFGKGPFSSDDEIIAALCFKRFLEKKSEKTYTIGFKVAENKITNLPDWSKATLGDLRKVLRTMVVQNDPIDFLLCEGEVQEKKEHAFGIQVKRFHSRATESTQEMADYLTSSMIKKYGFRKLKTTLLLMVNTANFNLTKLHKAIKEPYPFSNVFFFGAKAPHICFGEIYPKLGYEMYVTGSFIE